MITHTSARSLPLLAIQTTRVFFQRTPKWYHSYHNQVESYLQILENSIFNNTEPLRHTLHGRRRLSLIYAYSTTIAFHRKRKPKTINSLAQATLKSCQIKQVYKNYLLFLHQTQQDWQPKFHTTNTTQLAKTIYETQNYTLCPILADALMDAGYENQLILHLLQNPCQDGTAFLIGRGTWLIQKLVNPENL